METTFVDSDNPQYRHQITQQEHDDVPNTYCENTESRAICKKATIPNK